MELCAAMLKNFGCLGLAAASLLGIVNASLAEDGKGEEHAPILCLESAGARFGFPANTEAKDLHQAEVFANFDFPWRWHFIGHTEMQLRLDLSAGWLGGRGEDAFVGTLGPTLKIEHPHF